MPLSLKAFCRFGPPDFASYLIAAARCQTGPCALPPQPSAESLLKKASLRLVITLMPFN